MTRAPHDGRILTALWSVYTEQGAHDKALAAASAVAADSPFARRARFDVGLSLIELKRFDGAFKELTALHTQRRSAAISNALGVAQLRRGVVTDPTRLPARVLRAGDRRGAGEHRLSVQSWLRTRVGGRHGGRAGQPARIRPPRCRRRRRASGDERRAGRHWADDGGRPRARTGPSARHVARDAAGVALDEGARRPRARRDRPRRAAAVRHDRRARTARSTTDGRVPPRAGAPFDCRAERSRRGRATAPRHLPRAVRGRAASAGSAVSTSAVGAWPRRSTNSRSRSGAARRPSRVSRSAPRFSTPATKNLHVVKPSARSRSPRRSPRLASCSRRQEACSNMPAHSMTDQQFHEIQLSGKQLVFVFISVVGVAVVIFLLGVSVGRGVRGTPVRRHRVCRRDQRHHCQRDATATAGEVRRLELSRCVDRQGRQSAARSLCHRLW